MTAVPPEAVDWNRSDHCFMIGAQLVDPTRNVISASTGDVAVEPRIMDVLCFLAEHPGEALLRGQIVDAVWARSFGADESLTRAISRLRKVFGDVRSPAKVIETIPKRGYRLIAPVSPVDKPPVPGVSLAVPNIAMRKSVPANWGAMTAAGVAAVLLLVAFLWHPSARQTDGAANAIRPITVQLAPFESLEPNLDRSARIVSDQVAGLLSQSSLLAVKRDIGSAAGRTIGNAYAVSGTLQRISPDTLRVAVTVTDNESRTNLWSGTFNRLLKAGTANAADDLAGTIAGELDNRILSAAKVAIRKKPPTDLVPWELTLLATWVPGSDEVFLEPHGVEPFWLQQRALTLDPNYAAAHASLASAMAYHALFESSADGVALRRDAREHAERARALAPYDAGVLYELATYYRLIGARSSSIAALDRVLAIQPGHPVAGYDRMFVAAQCTAHARDAGRALERSLSSVSVENPVRWVILSHIADLDLAYGNIVGAAKAANNSRQIVRMTWSGITLAASSAASGDSATARSASEDTRREWPALDWGWFARTGISFWCLQGPNQEHARASFKTLDVVASATEAKR